MILVSPIRRFINLNCHSTHMIEKLSMNMGGHALQGRPQRFEHKSYVGLQFEWLKQLRTCLWDSEH